MSRAFVKESDADTAAEIPERQISTQPNYVTPRGLALLRAQLAALHAERDRLAAADDAPGRQRLQEVKRDIRYFNAQIDRAEVVEPAAQPRDTVHFGATITLLDADNRRHLFRIVGDDEADPVQRLISWATPLAKALLGARVGDSVKWPRPDGAIDVEIAAIDYAVDAAPPAGRAAGSKS